jgi:hypothetical protein
MSQLPLRLATAVGSVLIGAIHLRLYFDSYRDIDDIGRSFILNAVAAGVAAVIVLLWPSRLAFFAPLVVANATLVAFGLSRTDQGIFNFSERGWNPSPDAVLAVVIEIVTAVLAVVGLVLAGARPAESDAPPAAPGSR